MSATFDQQAVRSWLAILHGDSPGLLNVCATDAWTGRTFPTGDLAAAAGYVAELDRQRREGIYVRVTSLKGALEPGKRGGVADTASLPALWADVDFAGPGHKHEICSDDCPKKHTHITKPLPPDEEAAHKVITASGLPDPTLWIHSGGGLYPIWLLDTPHVVDDDLADVAELTAGWQRAIENSATQLGWHYGRGVGDLARVLRVPGTVNRKEGLERPCRIVSATARRYSYRELQVALADALAGTPEPEPAPAAGTGYTGPGTSPGDDYAARTDWAQILEPHGWQLFYQREGVRYWTRPGKTTGVSATTNALGSDRLHIFTDATEFQQGTSYSKFGAYALLEHAGDHSAAAKALAEAGYGTPMPNPADEQREAFRDILGDGVNIDPPSSAPMPTRQWAPEIDVTNPALAAEWLRDEAGRGRLAGLFRRIDAVVHTPREGEDGYLPLGDAGDEDGPAQVRPIYDSALASRITYTYGVYRLVKRGEDWVPTPALFPRSAARTALDVPDMLPNLRPLRGVIHSPVFRADGSLVEAPGYDAATGLLHLPEPGLSVPAVPAVPTAVQVAAAVALLDEMLDGFPFVSAHYRANYLGALITPLLRTLAPPPYKLHAIEAHQPGSGKTLLANLARFIHGGVFRAEVPDEDTELRKQITAILSITTGPVVVLDNLSGALRSSTLAGLLTSNQWDDRPLGSTAWSRCANDRLWTITGNNLNIGGDLPRRTLRTVIDPGQPNPELRTGFAIADLESWVRERRGDLLHALLTLVRAWVTAGMPQPAARASDGYARWVRTVTGILAHAGIEGVFDHPSTQVEVGTDDDEWATFLTAVHRAYGDRSWTAKELLADVDTGNLIKPGTIPIDALPSDLETKAARPGIGVHGLTKSLGWWLRNRDGRWAGGLTVRAVGEDGHKAKLWQIRTTADARQP